MTLAAPPLILPVGQVSSRGLAAVPVDPEQLEGLRVDEACVSVAEFATFARETGYVSVAERAGASAVFSGLLRPDLRRASPTVPGAPWWRLVEGADWAHPEGPGSDVAAGTHADAGRSDRADHPVVHLAAEDAEAFAAWCGMRLPTEEEWERAARGGLEGTRYPWGDELVPDGEHMANLWQGSFPLRDTAEDGYRGTAPVRSFPPNDLGLYEVTGNVWEWCAADAATGARAVRGGSYLGREDSETGCGIAARATREAAATRGDTGMRLVTDGALPWTPAR
ncbi:formylglycine-generating enzyme family protein [Brachybacterium horti]